MAVLFTAAKLDKIKKALDSVSSVAQAWAAVTATQKLANDIAAEIKQTLFEDAWRTGARKDIANMQASVQREAKALLGADGTMAVGTAWATLRPAVSNLWFYALTVQGQFPPDESSVADRLGAKMSLAADSLLIAVNDAPQVIVKSVAKVAKTATKIVGAVVKPVAGLVGETAGALLGPVKWILFGLAGVVVLGGVGYMLVSTGKVKLPGGAS